MRQNIFNVNCFYASFHAVKALDCGLEHRRLRQGRRADIPSKSEGPGMRQVYQSRHPSVCRDSLESNRTTSETEGIFGPVAFLLFEGRSWPCLRPSPLNSALNGSWLLPARSKEGR